MTSSDVVAAVAQAHRRDWAQVLATTARLTRNLDLAEECAQEAFAQALATWPGTGIPGNPGGWLTHVARNKAHDALRREAALKQRLPLLVTGEEDDPGDERLMLIFTCCHPALARETQVALTLKLVCGLSTVEVARAFLVSEPTMAARLTRAKKKIAAARIPYRVPTPEQLGERLGAVLDVVHLIFTTGHAPPAGDQVVRRDLVDGAIALARLLHLLMPAEAEVTALLALLLFHHARSASRHSGDGALRLLQDQDRTAWDRTLIDEAASLLAEALRRRPPSRFAVQAALSAVHAEAPSFSDTDWSEIVALYDVLRRLWPGSSVVDLNRAVAVGMRDGPQAGLDALDPLLAEPSLATYGYLSAARADFLRRLGRTTEAADAYREALALTANEAERAFLSGRLGSL
ncbi:RNA polymerase sigma factor [Actinoplanes sp. NPDC051343]|uniref:RNA polymerase sigma factor n=1 Tax=Actinoplanes sp. NPDC051343 TaxID=3363906 RepID=UPI00378CEB86